jgi:hypothetical protein
MSDRHKMVRLHSSFSRLSQTCHSKCSSSESRSSFFISHRVKVKRSSLIHSFRRRWMPSIDICQTVHCGSGTCIQTQNPSLPYFCRCPSGANTILPCPMESKFLSWLIVSLPFTGRIDPCSRNPCGQGACEAVPSLIHGYLCRCAGDVISLTTCNGNVRRSNLSSSLMCLSH